MLTLDIEVLYCVFHSNVMSYEVVHHSFLQVFDLALD